MENEDGDGNERQNMTTIRHGQQPLDDSADQIIDNGIMYMDKDKIVYYNQRDESEDGSQNHMNTSQLRLKALKGSVNSQYFVDGNHTTLEGADFSKIIDDSAEIEKI